MKVSCPSCSSVLNIDDKKIPPGGARIKCPSCQNVFPVKPQPVAASPSGLVPLPGLSAAPVQRQTWEEESTRVGNVPLPGASIPGATTINAPPTNVKLPGAAAPSSRPSGTTTVPLPGMTAAVPQKAAWEEQPTRVSAPPLATITAATPHKEAWEEQSTRVAPIASSKSNAPTAVNRAFMPPPEARRPEQNRGASIPLPGATDQRTNAFDAIALPGADRTSLVPPLQRTEPAIELPGGGYDANDRSVPLPGGAFDFDSAPAPQETFVGDSPSFDTDFSNVPLPGGSNQPQETFVGESPDFSSDFSSVPLPGGASYQAPPEDDFSSDFSSVPLPGGASRQAPPEHDFSTDFSNVPLPGGASRQAPPQHDFSNDFDAVSLPGRHQPPPLDDGFSTNVGAVPLPGEGLEFDPTEMPETSNYDDASDADVFDVNSMGAVPVPVPQGFDFDAAPPPPALGGGFDFDAAPPPPASGGFNFDAAPPPPAPVSGGFDFSESPQAPGAFSFDAPPAPAAVPSFDFSSAPPTGAPQQPPPSMGFGEVDFGGGGDLEFDPTGGAPPPPAQGKAFDDLEADLSAPIPISSPSGPIDGLEMLSFIDKTAKEAGANPNEQINVRRFHVKRRSGKVFGPFEEAVVAKMLEDGQLLGNEEVSLDAESWAPIGAEPAFQATIAKLMESPARTNTQQGLPQVEEQQRGPSMDRLKQLYEGRMAAVAVVQSKDPIPFKKKLPFIVAGVLAAAFLISGIAAGVATPYGFFALKLLFPAKVKPDTREFGYLAQARNDFMLDTWKSYQDARDQAAQALAIKEYPEARAVWSQAVFYLERKFNKAGPGEVEQGQSELVNVRLLGDKHPETLRTEASAALSRNDPDAALTAVGELLARDSENLEGLFLRAEAYQLKKQPGQAKAEYEAVLKKDPKNAKAMHALGALSKAGNEVDEAIASFTSALEAAPGHLSSAVELAELSIVNKKDLKKGAELINLALNEEGRPTLSPAQAGKALALRAEMLVVEGKLADAVPIFEEALKIDPTNAFTSGHLARAYSDLNQPEKAIPLYQTATRAQPENLEYTEGYLSALIVIGKMEEATQVMAGASQRFPDEAMLQYLSARIADKLDNNKEAEEAYKRAIARDSKIVDAYLYLSRYYMRFKNYAEAAPVLEKGLVVAPDNAGLRVGMGELALHERDVERARSEFQKAIALNEYSADAHLGASKVALERGELELSAKEAERALELNPRLPGGRLQRGVVLWKLKRLEEAVTELEAARQAEPKDTQVVVTLGAVKFDKGDLNGALEHLNAALIGAPSHADANFYLARVKNAKGEHSQAIEAIKHALEQEPKNPLYLYWYGRVLADARKVDDAIAEFKLALEVEPKYADALEALGKISFDRNEHKKAVEYYEKVLLADPARVQIYGLIGDAQMKMDDWSGAINSYQRALAADPKLTASFAKLGIAFQEKGQPSQAIEWFKKAVDAEKEDADSWLALGYLYKENAKKKEAKSAFQTYLTLRPEAENAKEVGDQIYYLDQK